MNSGEQQLIRFKRRWQGTMVLESLLVALGAGVLGYLATDGPWVAGSCTVLAFGLALWAHRPWALKMGSVVAHIDAHLPEAAHSSGLLVQDSAELPGLSRLQRFRVEARLAPALAKLWPPHHLGRSLPLALALGLLGLILHHVPPHGPKAPRGETPTQIGFKPLDPSAERGNIPVLERISISVAAPAYTRLPRQEGLGPNIRAVEGSRISWRLEFQGDPTTVHMDRLGEMVPLAVERGGYGLDLILEHSGFYSFTFVDAQGHAHRTDLHSLEALADLPPSIEVEDLPLYSQLGASDPKILPLRALFDDDYGLGDAYIVATVSKGSGESVKFREEILRFEGIFPVGNKKAQGNRTLDLDELGLDPGDELYFHIVALDQREPTPNISRSETYFAQVLDSAGDRFAVEGGMGVDLMPQYFRSQRQLIIDTERLIEDRPKISEQAFNTTSNGLGHDQKSLRLKYGQFMGDETQVQAAPGGAAPDRDPDGQGEAGEKDPLEGFRHDHDHDSENGHDQPAEDPEGGGPPGDGASNPLHEYLHNHDDPEESTFFEQSLKEKLRTALDIMWDAELQLRLYQPERSLPYQYKALELLQDIKNSARIYVHRIGFDPPPIKEESRLGGNIVEIRNFDKRSETEFVPAFAAGREAAARLERLAQGAAYTPGDGALFHRAGIELADAAVDRPLKYLKVLRGLRDLERADQRNPIRYREVLGLLLGAIPPMEANPGKGTELVAPIDLLYLKALGTHE